MYADIVKLKTHEVYVRISHIFATFTEFLFIFKTSSLNKKSYNVNVIAEVRTATSTAFSNFNNSFSDVRNSSSEIKKWISVIQCICYEKAGDWPNKNRNFTVQN